MFIREDPPCASRVFDNDKDNSALPHLHMQKPATVRRMPNFVMLADDCSASQLNTQTVCAITDLSSTWARPASSPGRCCL